MGVLSDHRRSAFVDRRPAADDDPGRIALGCSLVRQRNGVFNSPRRNGCAYRGLIDNDDARHDRTEGEVPMLNILNGGKHAQAGAPI